MGKGTVRVDIDLKDVRRALDAAIAASSPPVVTEAIEAAMAVYQKGAQDRAPQRSGALAASIEVTRNGPTSASVSTDSKYALIQEFGGTVVANKQKLKFAGRSGIVFIRKVRINAQPYFLPTFDSDTPEAEQAFGNVFDRAFTR